MRNILTYCLTAPAAVDAIDSLSDWQSVWRDVLHRTGSDDDSVGRAVLAGYRADRIGWAFLAGYQAAIGRMFPGRNPGRLASFSVTEAQGKRPRDMKTTVQQVVGGQLEVNGEKSWVALASQVDDLIVAARLSARSEPPAVGARPQIRMLCIPGSHPGVQYGPTAPLKIIPEVPHSSARFDAVRLPAAAMWAADGYATHVKPFRVLEDIHIAAAVQAYLLRTARRLNWPSDFAEQLVAGLLVLDHLVQLPPQAASTHIALSGALTQVHQRYQRAGELWAAHTDDPQCDRWQRDCGLFSMAEKTRELRAQRAWQQLDSTGE